MRPLALFLVLLLVSPVSAQVVGSPFSAGGGGGGGGGGGNVTGTFTTGVVPMGTAAHTLADSLNAVVIGTNGSIGFNNAHYAEIVSGGASLANAGVFATLNSDLTIHSAASFSRWGLTLYNDADGIANAGVITVSGTGSSANIDFEVGDGAGSTIGVANFSPAESQIVAMVDATHFSRVDVQPTLATLLVLNDSNVDRKAQVYVQNAANTLHASNLSLITSGLPASVLEATNANGTTQIQVFAPLGGANSAVIDILNYGTSAGDTVRLDFWDISGSHQVGFQAPDSITPRSGTGLELRLPGAAPAVTGQPIVGLLDGDGVHVNLSFAAGVTSTATVCASGACLTTCTMIFVGGIRTGGTC